MQHWQKIVRPLAWVVLILVLTRIGLRAAIESVTKPAASADAVPAARFDVLEHAVVVGPQDEDATAEFALSNAGERRLVVRKSRRACCDPPGPPPLILDAGESGTLTVQTPAGDLLKHGEFRQGFGTNDPRLPEVWLTLRLANEPTPAVRPTSTTSSSAASSGRSVLVNRP
jgi:hypothetical protein